MGFVKSSADGGATWTPARVVDNTTWLGGPIRCVGSRCIVPAVAGSTVYTTDGGLNADSRTWKTVACGDGWHAGPFVADGDQVRIVGVQDCVSVDRGDSFTCGPPVDSVFDGGVAVDTASGLGLTGGGAISPTLSGWVHRSTDGGATWVDGRALSAPFPIRFVGVFGSPPRPQAVTLTRGPAAFTFPRTGARAGLSRSILEQRWQAAHLGPVWMPTS
eukprot:m.53969 g.53969  ORF g.53969 m.53969 type:complete len:217 (-) comp16729_c0_seq1:59-709(-)